MPKHDIFSRSYHRCKMLGGLSKDDFQGANGRYLLWTKLCLSFPERVECKEVLHSNYFAILFKDMLFTLNIKERYATVIRIQSLVLKFFPTRNPSIISTSTSEVKHTWMICPSKLRARDRVRGLVCRLKIILHLKWGQFYK